MAGRPTSMVEGTGTQQLNNVVKLISEAQTLDANGDELGAYRHYLMCVAQMAQTLSNDIQANQGQGTLSQHQCLQLFKMARSCLDRGEKIYTVAKQEQRPLALFRLASPSPTPSPTQTLPPIANGTSPSLSHPHQLEKVRTWPENLAAPTRTLVNVRAVGREEKVDSPAHSQEGPARPAHFSYLDRAKLHNKHMMEQYKAYLRETRTTNHLPSDVGLSMLRRLEENVGVAKIKEQNIARRLRERELRLQQEARLKKNTSVVNLSVDELCDLVTSFEHGKAVITTIKAKLNTAESNDGLITNISEILHMADHPLYKLLGEGQYSVYMILQPLMTAIEKAGGLPQLEIRLDNCGLDRKPSLDLEEQSGGSLTSQSERPASLARPPSSDKSTSPATRPSLNELTGEVQDDDDLLDLLTEEDEDLLSEVGTQSLHTHRGTDPTPREQSPLYHTLEPTKPQEENPDHLYHTLEPGSVTSGQSSDYQRFNFTSNMAYMNSEDLPTRQDLEGAGPHSEKREEPRYVTHESIMSAKKLPSEPTHTNGDQEKSGVSPSRPNGNVHEGDSPSSQDHTLYTRLDELGDKSHLYECLDALEGIDGSMLSRPPEPEVVFKNLPPLVCAAHFGDEASLLKLSDTATSVIKEAVKIIQTILNKLEEVFVKCYPVLSSEENREVCCTVLETSFFPPILPSLSLVYRCKNYEEECAAARNMCQQVNATPKDLSVRPKFWLIEQTYAPYGEAIDELRRLPSLPGPTPKLDGLVKMSKRIMKCIDEYYESQGNSSVDTSGVGVDDILPIISYIILRSGLPQLVSECSLMEDFIKDEYMCGEEGFCLTSFITALKYVSHMSS